MYDEKAKARNIRSLQKNFEQVRMTVKKGTLAKYKAFAETQGMSMTAYITALMEREMSADGFSEKWDAERAAEEEAERKAVVDAAKADNAASLKTE